MSGTVEQPPVDEQGIPAPDPQEPAAAVRLCASCAAPLQAGQDWCLECGSAQPGRLGNRAGWRAALTIVGATGVLALGAGAAAYAALSSEAQREASAAAPPAATPVVTAPPAQTAPPAPAETTPEVDAPDSEPADIPDVEAPPTDSADVPDASGDFSDDFSDDFGDDFSDDTGGSAGTGGSGGSSGGGGNGGGDDDDATTTEPEKNGPGLQSIPLSAGAASTYDPSEKGGELVGDPADAIDGKASTAWEAPVDADGNVGIGLLVSVDDPKFIKKLEFAADTPGFEVEIYASAAETPPATLSTPGWAKIGTRTDVGLRSAITIGRRPYRHVLLWIVSQPADTKVAIPEVDLLQ